MLAFFGLTHEYRLILFKQIHEIVFFGQGGYDWDIVYNMPIWLRNLTYNLILEHHSSKNKDAEKSWIEGQAKQEAAKNKKLKYPIYNTEVSKK